MDLGSRREVPVDERPVTDRLVTEREAWEMVERHRLVQEGEADFRDAVGALKAYSRGRDGEEMYLESAVVEAVYAAVGAGGTGR